jgi:hypothetical protein
VRVTLPVRALNVPGFRLRRIEDTLRGLGHEVVVVLDREFAASGEDLVWLSGSLNWYPQTCRRLSAMSRAERPTTALWQTEPLPPPSASGLRLERLHAREIAKVLLRNDGRVDPRSNAQAIRRMLRDGVPDVLAVSTLERREFLAEHGIASVFAPMGYDDALGTDLGLERDIDVLFLGSLEVPRRKRILRELRRADVNVVALGNWRDPALWGERRVLLLNRTKILLNIPRHEGLLSGARMLLGMANKALVVAEPIYEPAPYRPGTHYVSAELDDFPEAIARSLANDVERRRIVDAAHDFVTTKLPLSASVESIIQAVEEKR